MRYATPNAAAVRVVDTVGNPRKPGGGHHDLLGEGTVQPGAGDPVTDRETVCPVAGLDDYPGEFAAGHEWRRHADLVLVGDQQHIGKVHRGRADLHSDLSRRDGRRRPLLDTDDFRRPVGRADRGAHVSDSRWIRRGRPPTASAA